MIRIAAQYLFSIFLFCNLSIAAFNPLTSQIQTYLREMQIDTGDIDGVYGPKTKAAIIEFQKLAGLTPDGVADKALLYNMRRYYAMYTDHKYSYYQDNVGAYQYSDNQSKCQRALNELSTYSDSTAKYNSNNYNNVYYDSRWNGYSPQYNKRNHKISRKLSKLDRLMRRVHSNCEKRQYYTKRSRHHRNNYYQPRHVDTSFNQRYVKRQYLKPRYDASPFLDAQENKMYRMYK
ncbi:MAG: peptidoglycan-binding protein [Candidatus Cloacimonetes bacterium]|nr:peptidoglycan-binding protein [Candidatus Cloacimonadota bacterium]